MNSHFNDLKISKDSGEALVKNLRDFPKLSYINGDLNRNEDLSLIVFKLSLLYFAQIRIIELDPIDFIDFNDFMEVVRLTVDWSKRQEWKFRLVMIPLSNKILVTTYKNWHIGSLCQIFKETKTNDGVSKITPKIYTKDVKPIMMNICEVPYKYEIYAGSDNFTSIIHTFYAQRNTFKINSFLDNVKDIFSYIFQKEIKLGMFESSLRMFGEVKGWVKESSYLDPWADGEHSLNMDDESVVKYKKVDYRQTGKKVISYLVEKYLK